MKILAGIIIAVLLLSLALFLYLNYQTRQKSQAQLSFNDSSVNASFQINSKDQQNMQQFSNNLGVSTDWTRGITLKFDQDTVNFLSKVLPKKLSLSFAPKEVDFNNQGLSLLNSSLPAQSYRLATGSANLNLKRVSNESFTLDMIDPAPLLRYATSSGKLYLSNELQGLFPILDKIATIELKVNGGDLQGQIKLK